MSVYVQIASYGNKCLAAIDMKFAPAAGKTKSMTITIADIKPEKAIFVIPECANPYNIDNKTIVADIQYTINWLKSTGL